MHPGGLSGPDQDSRRPAPSWRVVVAAVVGLGALLGGAWLLRGPAPAAEPPRSAPAPESFPSARPDSSGNGPVPAQLTWAPPVLKDPQTIQLTADDPSPELKDGQDYLLELPDEPLVVKGGVTISGGRNIVLIGGEIQPQGSGRDGRAILLQGQTGTVHIEGVLLAGARLAEGINLDERDGAVVQLQNIRVETVRGEQDGHHADVIQSWAGPESLRIDRLSGSTTYQGMFLLPTQFGGQDPPREFDLRNVDLVGTDGSGYLLWRDDADWPIYLTNVWVTPPDTGVERNKVLWARGDQNRDTWDGVQIGLPPGGPFVPDGVAGVGYESPGYLEGSGSRVAVPPPRVNPQGSAP